jgi:tetratricopeptide (TPR) repeat protein
MPCAMAIGQTLGRANHQATLIALAEDTLDRGLIDQAMLFIVTLFGMHRRLSVPERLLGADAMVRFADKMRDRGEVKIAAQMQYNAGSLFRDIGAHRRAIHIYRKAAAIDPSYLERSYFWQEIAGMLFMKGRWSLSAKLYRRALELEDSDETAFLLADALFFSGEFAEAHQIWGKRLDTLTEETAIWFLKLRAADIILGTLRVERQRRQPKAALAAFTDDITTDAQIELACARALQLDPLCNLAWFNLGGVRVRAGNMQAAAMSYVVAAVTADWDVQAWGNLIAAADRCGDATLKMTAEIAGSVQRRHSLVSEMAGRVPDDAAERYAELMTDVVDELPQPWKRATLRDHGRDGRWVEVTTDDDDDDDRVEVIPGTYEIRPVRRPNAAERLFTAIRNLFR